MKTAGARFVFVILVTCALVGVVPDQAAAQDTHYWNKQYGPRSMLLGGAVIGSVQDMSATYYNPGAMGYIEKPELLLSANAYEITSLTIKDGRDDGINVENSDFNPLPNMLAGAFRFTWLRKNKLAYSFLTRHSFDAEVSGARVGPVDILPQPGEEDFAGAIDANRKAKELWAGVTWARGAVGRKVGFGVTNLPVDLERRQWFPALRPGAGRHGPCGIGIRRGQLVFDGLQPAMESRSGL